MGGVIFEETVNERRTANAVRDEVRRRIAAREWDREAVAGRLGLVPAGLDALLRRRWTLEEAFRVAEAVGIDFRGTLAVVERHAA